MRIAFPSLLLLALLAPGANGQYTRRVSIDPSGIEPDRSCYDPVVADLGHFVAFESDARNLIAGDNNFDHDIFVKDLVTGTIERANLDSAGHEANAYCYGASISADGRYVAFYGLASNLVANDTNNKDDVFLRDRTTATTTRISVKATGGQANGASTSPSLSRSGRYVVFTSKATNLVTGDANGKSDLFLVDRDAGTIELVSVDSNGVQGNDWSDYATVSSNGRWIAFISKATNFVANDTNKKEDVFVRDRVAGTTVCVSLSTSGKPGNDRSDEAQISANGDVVVFQSLATNLVSGDTNTNFDVFAWDRAAGTTTRVSVDSAGTQAATGGTHASISADGNRIAFMSGSTDLVPGDTNGREDIFVRDVAAATTMRISVGNDDAEANNSNQMAAIAGDGSWVAFGSWATTLGGTDANGWQDIYARWLDPVDASVTSYGSGVGGFSGPPTLSTPADPQLGTTVFLDISNSLGAQTIGLLYGGHARAATPWKGGTLLVDSEWIKPLVISTDGIQLIEDLPDDLTLAGTLWDLQVIEADAFAPQGIAFSAGLELVLGY